ncbi:hypothetical protein [Salinarimonas sp.]|uniref:hypothetical protein n=1 Tax=Salinarimonas sp. TaxID=2766526 RepID=UPI0032D98559
MLALALLGHFLDVATSPFVLAAPLLLALATGRRAIVRLGAVGVATLLALLPALEAPTGRAIAMLGLGALAGAVVAEIWIGLVLPLAAGVARGVRRLRRGGDRP